MASATRLTRHDATVLSALFDPEASLSNVQTTHGKTKVSDENYIQQIERSILLEISTEDPSAHDLSAAIGKLDNLIERYPTYASAYNNRAEARRLLTKTDQTADEPTSLTQIFDDLGQAIKLANSHSLVTHLSSEQTSVLSSAYTHRAYLFYQGSRSQAGCKRLEAVLGISGLTQDTLEEMASKDFAMGGRYGHKIAKQLAVHTNPYAKLCGSIVKEAMKKEIQDYWASNPETTT